MATLSGSATMVMSGLCLYKGDDDFYSKIAMPLLQKLMNPEQAHRAAVWAAKHQLLRPGAASKHEWSRQTSMKMVPLETTAFGVSFPNPVGLAAGFDKDAECMAGMAKIGFGFIEVGSVTPEPQPGNDKPRVFRLSEDMAVINRYGFNSQGHSAAKERLRQFRCDLKNEDVKIGVNLGKNKASSDAAADYVKGVNELGQFADYLVINVSSPNTPGLRALQSRKALETLISQVLTARDALETPSKIPVLLKVAPDLTEDDKVDIVNAIANPKCHIDGLIVSNTTISRPDSLQSSLKDEAGGLSGQPLKQLATQTIADFYRLTQGKVPIIGVGGISSGQDAYEKICAGASVVQVYSALVFHGPPLVNRIKRELEECLRINGFSNVSQAVGSANTIRK